MQDKNSNPVREFCLAKSESFLSRVAAPASIILFFNNLRYEKFGLNLIIIPSTPPSLMRVFDPAPKILIFFFVLLKI